MDLAGLTWGKRDRQGFEDSSLDWKGYEGMNKQELRWLEGMMRDKDGFEGIGGDMKLLEWVNRDLEGNGMDQNRYKGIQQV